MDHLNSTISGSEQVGEPIFYSQHHLFLPCFVIEAKLDCVFFNPQKIDAVYLDIHSGSNLWGAARSDDSLNDVMARTCNVAVVSVEYRLAPEVLYPGQIQECTVVAKWLFQNALTAATILDVRDSLKAANKVLGVGLKNGMFDLNQIPSVRLATDSTPVLNTHFLNEIMKTVYGQFSIGQLQSPQFSPLYADLKSATCLFLSVISFADSLTHWVSRNQLIGPDITAEKIKEYSNEFANGGHGFGIYNKTSDVQWIDACIDWINQKKWNKK